MPDPKKRIIVDGVDFASLFQFPRIFRAVTAAMQPPRLVVALLMVVALAAIGRTWDAFTEADISPNGLLAGPMSVEEIQRTQDMLWDALDEYGVPESRLPARTSRLDPRRALAELERWYRTHREGPPPRIRAAIPGQPAGQSGEHAELPPGTIRQRDAEFLETVERIRAAAPMDAFQATIAQVSDCFNDTVQGVIYLRPQRIIEAWRDLFIGLPVELWRQERAFTVVFGIVFILIAAVGGGALCRMAACETAGRERLRVRDAFDFSFTIWPRLVMTLILPLLIAAIVAVVLLLFGLLLAPWLDVIGGPLYGLAVLLGFVLAFMLIGYAVGLPMLLPAVACENCDPVDAQQRAFFYLLNRPLHLLGYAVVALIGLALGYLVVALFASLMLNFTAALVGALTGNSALSGAGGLALFDLAPRSPGEIHENWHNRWAAWTVAFWQRVVIDLVAAYIVSYLFSATTTMYLLMRRVCDGQDIEEIWRPGLAPGTLVPLPRTEVHPASAATPTDEPEDDAATERD